MPTNWVEWLTCSFLAGIGFTAGAFVFTSVIGLVRKKPQ